MIMKKTLVLAITLLFVGSVYAQEIKLKEEKAVAAPAEIKEEKGELKEEKSQEKMDKPAPKAKAKKSKKVEAKKSEAKPKSK